MRRFKYIFVLSLSLLMGASVLAQPEGLSVKRFEDVSQIKLYARSADAPKDNLGNYPALLLVQVLSETEVAFTANYMLGNAKRIANEYWVYMAEGAKYVEISHPRYEKIKVVFNDVSNGKIPSLMSKCTYELVISVPNEIVNPQAPKRQYFKFFVEPADANVRVQVNEDWQWWPAEEGLASKSLDYGTYAYEVSHDNYHTQSGTIIVSQNSQQLDVNLRPRFGWLSIPCEQAAKGAYVFATNVHTSTHIRLGQLPLTNKELESGTYLIEIQKEKFKEFRTTAVISDGDTTVIIPQIEGNAGYVRLIAEDDVEIYLDNHLLGSNQWMGSLECGSHEIEVRKANHHSAYTSITVLLQDSVQTFQLNLPIQKYGALAIEGKPIMGTVYVDNKMVGKSPILVSQLAFGEHTVRIERDGYQSQTKRIVIDDEQEQLVEYSLTKVGTDAKTKKPAMEQTIKSNPKPTLELKEKVAKQPKNDTEKLKGKPLERRINTFVLANAGSAFKSQLWSAGLMFGQLYNGYGWYVKGRTNFQAAAKTDLICDQNYAINGVVPFYTGNTSGAEWVANIGFAMDFLAKKEKKNKNNLLGLYAGVGFGSVRYALEITVDQWIMYGPWSNTGLSIDAGLIGSIGGFTMATGVNMINFKHVEAEVSIGWTF